MALLRKVELEEFRLCAAFGFDDPADTGVVYEVLGDFEIETVERVVVRVEHGAGVIVGVARKEPIAVIVRSPAGTWRVDLQAASD